MVSDWSEAVKKVDWKTLQGPFHIFAKSRSFDVPRSIAGELRSTESTNMDSRQRTRTVQGLFKGLVKKREGGLDIYQESKPEEVLGWIDSDMLRNLTRAEWYRTDMTEYAALKNADRIETGRGKWIVHRIEIPSITVSTDSETCANYLAAQNADRVVVVPTDIERIFGSIKAYTVDMNAGTVLFDYQIEYAKEFPRKTLSS